MGEDSEEAMTPETKPLTLPQASKPEGKSLVERLESLLARIRPSTLSSSDQFSEAQAKMREEIKTPRTSTPTGKPA